MATMMDKTPPTPAEDRYRAPALDKGLDILEVLARQAQGLTRAEIMRELGVSPSQIYRMLERLVARGYVTRRDGGDRYALTMKLFLLAHDHPPLRRLTAQAQPLMDAFARRQRQSCHLVVPDRGAAVVVAQASPIDTWEFRVRIGARLDLFSSGSGKTLLAFQHPARRAETLGQWGLPDARDALTQIAPELKKVRQQGARIKPSAQAEGVTDISLPIFGPSGDAIAVVTCAYIRHPGDADISRRPAALENLRALAAELSLGEMQDQPE